MNKAHHASRWLVIIMIMNSTEIQTTDTPSINVVIHNKDKTSTSNSNLNHLINSCEQQTSITIHHDFPEWLKQYASQTHQTCINIPAILWGYKWYGIGGLSLLGYIKIMHLTYTTKSLLNNHQAWCNWKIIIPINELVLQNQSDLLNQLKHTITKKHSRIPVAQHDPMQQFLQNVEYELDLLQRYLKTQSFAQTICCSRLLPSIIEPHIIEERITRLNFILDLGIESYLDQVSDTKTKNTF